MNAEPQSLASSGFGGELFLGIRGDLYRMDCSKFLPHIYQQMLLYTFCAERISDFPVIQNQERKIPSVDGEEGEELKTIRRNVSLSRDVWRQTESDMDLSALIEGSVRCKKEKPRSTMETKRDAFDHYMKILYGLPLHLKIDLGDTFDPMKRPFNPEHRDYKPHNPPAVKEAECADFKGDVPVAAKTQKKAPETKSKPTTPMSVPQRPAPKVKPKKVVDVEKREGARNPPQIIPPIAPPKPKTPTPRPRKQKPPPPPPPPLPPRGTTPKVPTFLKQFTEADWFKNLFPDQKCISNILSPEDFSLQLLVGLTSYSPRSKVQILAALRALHSQRPLHNAHTLSQRLVHLLPTLMKPHMSAVERTSLVELFYLLMQLKCVDNDLGRELLTLLAFKKSGLRDAALGMLTAAGVHEAEKWLWPELESWDSELRDLSNIWKHLHHRADCWLELWISKYKEHVEYQGKNPTFSVVDVLNYFCCVQRDEYRKTRCVAPAARKNTLLLPLNESSQPILRLGETHSMSRTWRPPGIILPPLRTRPFLSHFPSFICLPVPRLTLRPFHVQSEDDWVKASSRRRYFIQQQSYVEYYR
ncbi:uncharacterized protein LOC132994196 isoform X2 [Labrus mixtus]|uniref:uncharacterized protein LOC132994196 isoform X2 n=1 Tax=Labrus mixtus TaxID=508554 RepID=UPI0029BFF660|nr:uncharacterized protein LOC132994196 isoform X2 [Labrus mixtus]